MMRQWVMTLKSVRSKLLKDLHLQKSNRYLDAYSSRTILDLWVWRYLRSDESYYTYSSRTLKVVMTNSKEAVNLKCTSCYFGCNMKQNFEFHSFWKPRSLFVQDGSDGTSDWCLSWLNISYTWLLSNLWIIMSTCLGKCSSLLYWRQTYLNGKCKFKTLKP
jgi:hypothetical protein